MKSLKQIIEGIVITSDFKLDKRGRKYKAHRTSMNMDQQESTNPHGDQIDEVSKETVSDYNKKAMAYIKNYKYSNNPPSVRRKLENRFSGVERADERLKGSKPTSEEVEQVEEGVRGTMISFKPSGKNGTEVRKNVDHIVKSLRKSHPQKVQHNAISYGYGDFKNDKEGKLGPTTGYVLAKKGHEDTVKKHIQSYGAKIVEEVEQVDEISKGSIEKYMNSAVPDYGHQNLISRVGKGSDKEEAIRKLANRSRGITRAVLKTTEKNMKEDTILEGATKIDQQSGSNRAFDVTHKNTNKKIGTVYTPGKTNPNHVATVNGMDGNPVKKAEFSSFKEAHKFITDNHPLTRDIDENVDIGEGMQQTLRKYVPGYAKSQINKKMDAEKFGRRDVDKDENYKRYKKVMDKVTKEEFTGFNQYNEGFANPYNEILEARGRPPSAATLAKRAAAKPREDEEEGEHYDADSGVEADQHIHVQLKKAADSDQKPFEVSFKNGKKHTVSQKVARDVLSATERLKPEHRKNVHDEIHQSYDNLISVHRLVAGK